MPRKKSAPVEPELSANETEELAVDITVDAEAVETEPMEDMVAEVVPEPEAAPIPEDEQVTRFSLDAPPARLAHLPRHQQKGLIRLANQYIAAGMAAHDALTEALR